MKLELSGTVPLWYHGDIYFSLQDRGPKEVDFDSLDDTTKTIVSEAIRRKILLESDGAKPTQQPKVEPQLEKSSIIQQQISALEDSANNYLKGSARNVIAWCKKNAKNANFQLLDMMLKIEKSKKASRKTVILALEESLENKGGVSAVIEDEEDVDEVIIDVV